MTLLSIIVSNRNEKVRCSSVGSFQLSYNERGSGSYFNNPWLNSFRRLKSFWFILPFSFAFCLCNVQKIYGDWWDQNWKLNHSVFDIWKQKLEVLLTLCKVEIAITTRNPEDIGSSKYAEWASNDKKARVLLGIFLTKNGLRASKRLHYREGNVGRHAHYISEIFSHY